MLDRKMGEKMFLDKKIVEGISEWEMLNRKMSETKFVHKIKLGRENGSRVGECFIGK